MYVSEKRAQRAQHHPGLNVGNWVIDTYDSFAEAKRAQGSFYLRFEDPEPLAMSRVQATQKLCEQRALPNDVNQVVAAYEEARMHALKADLLAGRGFPTLLFPLEPPTELVMEMALDRIQDSIKTKLGAETFDCFVEYMKVNRLGVIPLIDSSSTRKTRQTDSLFGLTSSLSLPLLYFPFILFL